MKIQVILEVPEEDADPNDDTGLTEEAYLEFCTSMPYDIVSGPKVYDD